MRLHQINKAKDTFGNSIILEPFLGAGRVAWQIKFLLQKHKGLGLMPSTHKNVVHFSRSLLSQHQRGGERRIPGMFWSASLVKLVRSKVESSSGMTSGVDLWSLHTRLCTCIHTWLLTHAQSPSLSPSISLSRHKDSPLQSGRKKITYSKPGHVRHCLTLFFFLNKQTTNPTSFPYANSSPPVVPKLGQSLPLGY